MRDRLCGSEQSSCPERGTRAVPAPLTPLLSPSDPSRQARRLPVRLVRMLTAHSGHLLHPEYLQPLTSAPVSIELDAKKSPLALLAQTCSQIGKPDPPSSSKLSSLSSGDSKESSGRTKSGDSQSSEEKSSFKPYAKSSSSSSSCGEAQKDVIVTKGSSDKPFRLPSSSGSSFPPHARSPSSSFPPHARSPVSHSPPLRHSPSATRSPSTRTPPIVDPAPTTDCSSTKKDSPDACRSSLDGAQLANSSHVRASANSSNASSSSSPRPESKPDVPPSQPGLSSGHIAPVSPFKPGHSVYPLPPASMGYHGSVIGAYAGYPSQFVPSLDKSSLGLGLPGKHPSSSPLTGASPPSLMQGLCRDPYCLTYPSGAHLGGSNCTSCVHDPSSSIKPSFPLLYPSHPLHSLPSPGGTHPLYTYGFMLPNDPLPHACNWVSVGGPCDKRFATSEELLAHLRTHTALSGLADGKMLYPSSASSSSASCHLHLPPPSTSFSLRGSPGLGLARYHPYGKSHLGAPALPLPSVPSVPSSSPYYAPYALYSQRLGSASALGYH